MNKELLERADSVGSLQVLERGNSTGLVKSNLSSSLTSKKFTVLLLVAGVVVALVVCAAVLAAVGTLQAHTGNVAQTEQHERKSSGDPLIDLATKEQLLKQAVDIRAKRARGRPTRRITSCYSTQTNESYTAAHISGIGSRWAPITDSSTPILNPPNGEWNTQWVCANDSDAYVDGGMIFNMTDKKLYVPVCGYYHLTSQVYFYVTDTVNSTEDRLRYVSLEVRVSRNCGSGVDNFLLLRSYASLVITPTKYNGKATAHINDVVKICKGGTIEVFIPHYNPCCPDGSSQTTYLSAFLVSKTSCAPPRSLDYLQTGED